MQVNFDLWVPGKGGDFSGSLQGEKIALNGCLKVCPGFWIENGRDLCFGNCDVFSPDRSAAAVGFKREGKRFILQIEPGEPNVDPGQADLP